MSLGDNIRKTRKSQRMTQVCLAARAGMVQGLISQYETGKVTPNTDHLNRLADALGVSVAVLDESLLGIPAKPIPQKKTADAVPSFIERAKNAVMSSDLPAEYKVKVWEILEGLKEE